jgi:hypothetical protein
MMPGDDMDLTDASMLDPGDLLAAARAESVEDLVWALQVRATMGWNTEDIAAYILSSLISSQGAARAAVAERDAAREELTEAREIIETLTEQLGRARRLPRWLRWLGGVR